ncbi:MAG: Fe-S cluster assembly protein SufD [Chloroflexi bacterium]|jgi:Fe-S cluster assembly protein SufD|nr:Fe-S cluster assembly protein SufD [Chloroflexota bacterium]
MKNIDNTKRTIMKNLHWPEHWQADVQRASAWETAQSMTFPERKNEDWKWINFEYLDLDTLNVEKPLITVLSRTNHGISVLRADSKENLLIKPDVDTYSALNAALSEELCTIHIPKNGQELDTIHVTVKFNARNTVANTRAIIQLEKHAQAKVILELQTDTYKDLQALLNFQLEIRLDEGARLELMEVQNLGEHVSYISREYAHVHRDAHLNWTYVGLGSRVAKSFITVDLLGKGAETLMNGVYFSGSGQVIDLDTQQNHLAAQAHSDLLYKGAAIGNGKAIWEGMIYVDHIAQQTDSYQSNRNLILDQRAEIKTIPGLEINANDVSCSHGATVGRLNDDELFYSQSRGIPVREAEKLILEGFFEDVLKKSGDEEMTNRLIEQIFEKYDRNHQ